MGSRATVTWEVKEKEDQEGKQRCFLARCGFQSRVPFNQGQTSKQRAGE